MSRFARNKGYLGVAIQATKGTALAPSKFIKYNGGTTMTPEITFEQYNEGGDSQYPGVTLKERHNPNGDFELLARPAITGLLFAGLLGKDTTTGEAAPYTHTIIPEDPADMPWLTIERSIAGKIIERVKDARITEMQISGEAGKPITISATYQGLTSGLEAAEQETITYESNMPFIFWQGTYTADSVNVSSDITEFEITITNVFDEDEQHSEIVRGDMTLIRREISASFSYKANDTNPADYEDVYYGEDALENSIPLQSMYAGSIDIDLEYGATTGVKGLKITVPKIIHTQKSIELDAGSDESNAFECEGHAEKGGEEFVTVVVKNEDSTSYIPVE